MSRHVKPPVFEVVPFTTEQLAAAKEIRTAHGWFDVLTVDRNTVTVIGEFTDARFPKSTILEVR